MSLLRPVDELIEAYRRTRVSASGEPPVKMAEESLSSDTRSALRATLERGDGSFDYFRALAECVPDAVLYVDSQGMCRAHNRMLENVLGIQGAEIDAHSLRELAGGASYCCIEESVERALRGEETWLRQIHRRKDGALMSFDGHYVPHLGPDSQVHGFIALLTPIRPLPSLQSSAQGRSRDEGCIPGPAAEGMTPRRPLAEESAALRRIALAIQARRFQLYKQEIVHLSEGASRLGAWEVLLRMKDDAQRLIHPAAFLQIAESTGCMAELDRWVVNRLVELISTGSADATCTYHVNLCHDSLLNTSLASRMRQVLECGVIPAEQWSFEINESELARSRMDVMACAQALRILGCRVGLDRYTGETGLAATLSDLPIDFVKIDGSIVSTLVSSARSRARAQVIVKLARSNGIRTIAEHVESAEILEPLRLLGVDAVQGYGVAMPEPFE